MSILGYNNTNGWHFEIATFLCVKQRNFLIFYYLCRYVLGYYSSVYRIKFMPYRKGKEII